ncbi:hypothetical protein LC653_36555 [Nostoc sp. CHAB 5784]|uniref:hypothetical protein n=1 Tax=Nostoc mirabile TaxID=2907820 RepID=UPI001E5A75D2|nr:hypothetical protein [Nostoc mirabile]MCC5669209.1 hypothetical protein [Nostoc mirabile CHAB5784]
MKSQVAKQQATYESGDTKALLFLEQADQKITFKHGQALFEAALESKMSLWIAQAGHDDFTWIAGERHQQSLLSFQQLVEKYN